MKARIPDGHLVIVLNTDLSKSAPFDETKLTEYQKQVYSQLGPQDQEKMVLHGKLWDGYLTDGRDR